MATLRQHEDALYLVLSDAERLVSTSDLGALLSSVMLDFELRLTTKLFDVNRTVSAITLEKRRLVVVENVPEIVFRCCLDGVVWPRCITHNLVGVIVYCPCPFPRLQPSCWRLLHDCTAFQMHVHAPHF